MGRRLAGQNKNTPRLLDSSVKELSLILKVCQPRGGGRGGLYIDSTTTGSNSIASMANKTIVRVCRQNIYYPSAKVKWTRHFEKFRGPQGLAHSTLPFERSTVDPTQHTPVTS